MKSEKLWVPSSKPTDYGFENGLQVAEIDSGLRQGKTIQLATQEDMRRLAEESYNSNHMNKTVEQLRDPRYIRVFSGLGRVGIEVAIFGNENANKIQAVLYVWGGNFRHPNAIREAAVLACENPDAAIMVMNMPGVGNSGMLPESVRKEIRKTGSYGSLGEYVGPVIDHVAKDFDEVSVGGHSLGGRVATSSVAHMESKVNKLRLFDPVGSRKMGIAALGWNFIGEEGVELMRYGKESLSPSAKELGLEFLQREDPKVIEEVGKLSGESSVEFASPKQGWRQQLLTDPFALSNDGLLEDLLKAAPNVRNNIIIFVPEGSHLTNMRDVARIVGIVNGEPKSTSAEVGLYGILNNHTHNVMNDPTVLAIVYGADTKDLALSA